MIEQGRQAKEQNDHSCAFCEPHLDTRLDPGFLPPIELGVEPQYRQTSVVVYWREYYHNRRHSAIPLQWNVFYVYLVLNLEFLHLRLLPLLLNVSPHLRNEQIS